MFRGPNNMLYLERALLGVCSAVFVLVGANEGLLLMVERGEFGWVESGEVM